MTSEGEKLDLWGPVEKKSSNSLLLLALVEAGGGGGLLMVWDSLPAERMLPELS